MSNNEAKFWRRGDVKTSHVGPVTEGQVGKVREVSRVIACN